MFGVENAKSFSGEVEVSVRRLSTLSILTMLSFQ